MNKGSVPSSLEAGGPRLGAGPLTERVRAVAGHPRSWGRRCLRAQGVASRPSGLAAPSGPASPQKPRGPHTRLSLRPSAQVEGAVSRPALQTGQSAAGQHLGGEGHGAPGVRCGRVRVSRGVWAHTALGLAFAALRVKLAIVKRETCGRMMLIEGALHSPVFLSKITRMLGFF